MFVFGSQQTDQERNRIRLELKNLTETAGAQVVGESSQVLDRHRSGTLIGTGKLHEVADHARASGATMIVFGEDLSGSQVRNIEEECGMRVVDRTQVILDIFASRARSFEGKAQVKLAQLLYMLPRLVGQGAAMSRLGGGIGTRGPGETKLETDRRKIRKEISDLRRIVRAEGVRRQELRRRRRRQGVYTVGIVGYTNAGKTTLLSQLVRRFGQRDVGQGQDRLFDTLDLTSRRVTYEGRTFVITDTVGFIRDLPHHLIDAFQATLQEAVDADVLVHVVDAGSPFLAEEVGTVYDVLEHSLQTKAPVITLLNQKASLDLWHVFADAKAVDTVRGSVMDDSLIRELMETIDRVAGRRVHMHLQVPHDRSDIVADAYRVAHIERIEETADFLQVDLEVDPREMAPFVAFSSDPVMEDPFR